MESPREDPRHQPELSLDLRVVRELSQRGGRRAFNGLRRSLDAHPESLTRSLRRLERLGTVGHDGNGYFLVDGPEPAPGPRRPARTELLATVRLPPSVTEGNFIGVLAGRWFGPFRWVGTQEGRLGPSLVWSVPGLVGRLVVRWRPGALRVLAELPRDAHVDPALARAGDELLWHALSHLRSVLGDRSEPFALASTPGVTTFARTSDEAPGPWAS